MDVEGKRCVTCHEVRPVADFNRRARAADGLQARCRSCSSAWYVANRVQHMTSVRERNTRVRAENKRMLERYLLENPCVDCGEQDLRVLDLDHDDPADKRAEVGRLVAIGTGWRSVAEEIAKCSVRCANCHRRRTAAQLGWWRAAAEERRRTALQERAAGRLAAVLLVGPPAGR